HAIGTNRTAQRAASAQPHSSLRRKYRLMYQTDHDMRTAMMGNPVTTLTMTKASTLHFSMYSLMALRRRKYTAQTTDTRANARLKVSDCFTSGGNGYSSSANWPAKGLPRSVVTRKT